MKILKLKSLNYHQEQKHLTSFRKDISHTKLKK